MSVCKCSKNDNEYKVMQMAHHILPLQMSHTVHTFVLVFFFFFSVIAPNTPPSEFHLKMVFLNFSIVLLIWIVVFLDIQWLLCVSRYICRQSGRPVRSRQSRYEPSQIQMLFLRQWHSWFWTANSISHDVLRIQSLWCYCWEEFPYLFQEALYCEDSYKEKPQ